MNDSLELRASLEKLGLLLLAQAPARRAEGASILNALAVQLETRARLNVVEALLRALTAVLEDAGFDSRHGKVSEEVARLLHLCQAAPSSAHTEQREVDPQEEEPSVSYSLGPRALELVSSLRFESGMAVDRIYLLLKRYLGINIPLPDLQKIVFTLPLPAQPPCRRVSHSRR